METPQGIVDELRAAPNSVISFGAISAALVGSTYIVGEGKDVDVLVLVSDLNEAVAVAQGVGYELEGEEAYDTSLFYSVRRGTTNLLLTETPEFFEQFVKAAQLCRYFWVLDRDSRIKVHRLLMDNEHLYQDCVWKPS